jgi:hypothetical protein
MTRLPSGQRVAISLERLFVEVEDARHATFAAAISGVGFDRWRRWWIVAVSIVGV